MSTRNPQHIYKFNHPYVSHIGAWDEGELACLDEETAAWINRDLGIEVVEYISEPTPPEVSDGQQCLAELKAQADRDSRGKEEVMHSGNFKAVRSER